MVSQNKLVRQTDTERTKTGVNVFLVRLCSLDVNFELVSIQNILNGYFQGRTDVLASASHSYRGCKLAFDFKSKSVLVEILLASNCLQGSRIH